MGALAVVELVLEVEDRFGVTITEEDLAHPSMGSVGGLYGLLRGKLEIEPQPKCMTSMVFYRMREAMVDALGVPREAVLPQARTGDLLDESNLRHQWGALSQGLNWTLPRLPLLRARIPTDCRTVGGLVREVMWGNYWTIRRSEEGCSVRERDVWERLVRVISEDLNVPREMITPESRWWEDLGAS
jgi:hypothetical protein